MALEVGIVGLPGSGKTTLFTALTRTGAGEYGKTNVGMAQIADERLDALAEVVSAKKITPAAIRVQDVPGTGPALLGNLRQVDALLVVLDGFSPGADPAGDLENLQLELLVADRDHVEKRIERVEKQAKSGDAKLRVEVEELGKVLAFIDAGSPLSDYTGELPDVLEPLTTKPLLTVENGPGGIDLGARGGARGALRGGGRRVPRRRRVGARRGGSPSARRALADHVLHGGREGDAGVDAAPRASRRSTRRRRSTRTSRAASSAAR